MNELKALVEIDYAQLFLTMVAFVMGVLALRKLWLEFTNWFGIETKGMRQKREQRELIVKTANKLCALEERQNEFAENRMKDREQSLKIQKELVNSIEKINDKMDRNEEKTNKRVRAELKERIGQSYRYYHAKGEWNMMEKEALVDLISEYEAHGGVNSFVHDIVQPELFTWKIVKRN